MEIALLVVLFLIGGITGANQMMKRLERWKGNATRVRRQD